MLNTQEKNKYSRQLLLEEIGETGQEKLKKSRVLVIGAGGLGCPVLLYLNAAGVGTIGIMDFDTVEESNLHRQVLFNEDDIKKSKAIIAAEKLNLQNSLNNIEVFNERLTALNVESIFRRFDLVVDCTDNFPTRYLINDACALLNMPMVYGSIHRFQGQVSVFNFTLNEKKSPTLRCLFPVSPTETEIPSCTEAGVIGVLPGLIGMYQAIETIKLITGIGETMTGKILCIDTLSMNTIILEIERNPIVESLMPENFDGLRQRDYSFDCNSDKEIKHLSAEELKQKLDDSVELQFIDVRKKNELPVDPFKNSINIPLNEIELREKEISRDKMVVLFCRSGNRSRAAIEILNTRFSFINLYNLEGGLESWFHLTEKVQEKV